MEPFFLRCETCHARLRVRDERFVGQVQACPKCGSMVHIVAPPAEAAPAPEAVAAAAATTTLNMRLLAAWRDHSLLWISSVAATSAFGALVLVLALRGSDREVAAHSPTVPAIAEQAVEPVESGKQESPQTIEVETIEQTVETPPPAPTPPRQVEQVATASVSAAVTPPVVAPPAVTPPPSESTPAESHEQSRTLTLEPVPDELQRRTTNVNAGAVPNSYPPASEVETSVVEAKPQVARPPARVTNVADQLAVPIESIDLPAMPIGEFVNLISGMAAVPIQLDAKVLGEVGLSSRSTVTVQGDNTTVGKLLAHVLSEYHLTCVVRDGALVVVRAKR